MTFWFHRSSSSRYRAREESFFRACISQARDRFHHPEGELLRAAKATNFAIGSERQARERASERPFHQAHSLTGWPHASLGRLFSLLPVVANHLLASCPPARLPLPFSRLASDRRPCRVGGAAGAGRKWPPPLGDSRDLESAPLPPGPRVASIANHLFRPAGWDLVGAFLLHWRPTGPHSLWPKRAQASASLTSSGQNQ